MKRSSLLILSAAVSTSVFAAPADSLAEFWQQVTGEADTILVKAEVEELHWQATPQVTGFKARGVYFFPRSGSYYQQYFPMTGIASDKAALEKQIHQLEQQLKKNKFPSPKQRYGVQVMLQNLRNQLQPKTKKAALFVGAYKEWLVFTDARRRPSISQVREYYRKRRQPIPAEYQMSLETMGAVTNVDGDYLEASRLPYAFKRKKPIFLFDKFSSINTIVLRSIDAHSMGPSGIQIENR